MGFFQKIGDLFSKNTRLDSSKKNELVLVCKPSGGQFHVNSKLIVPEGFVFAFCARKHILDILPPGTTMISAITLPETSKRLKLYKMDSDGKAKKKFFANGYQILIEQCDGLIATTNEKILLYHGRKAIDFLKLQCEFSVKVVEPTLFLKMLFSEFEVLKNGEGNKITMQLVSHLLTKYLKKENILPDEIAYFAGSKREDVMRHLKVALVKYGLELVSFSWIKVQSKTRKNWLDTPLEKPNNSNAEEKEEGLQPFIVPKEVELGNDDDEFMFVTGEEMVLKTNPEKESLDLASALSVNSEEKTLQVEDERSIIKEQIKKSVATNGKFVDLSLGSSYNAASVRANTCPNCGEKIALSKINFCPLCGASLLKETNANE